MSSGMIGASIWGFSTADVETGHQASHVWPLHLQGPNGEIMVSTCIITIEPNELMAGIHIRMPVILPKTSWGLWMDPSAQTREVQPLLVPYPAELMPARPVSSAVRNVRNEGPELILPVA